MWKTLIFSMCLCFFYPHKGFSSNPSEVILREVLWMNTPKISYKFQVELAQTPFQQAQGFMNRSIIPENRAMLFVYPKEKILGFWMKNTQVSLDLVFLKDKTEGRFSVEKGGQLKIMEIIHGMSPYDLKSHLSSHAYKFALEFPGGTLKKYNLQKGDILDFHKENSDHD
jgi:uncharacterized membrane protein (UPF0127 family)